MPVLTALGKALDVSLGTLLPPDEFKERSLTVKFSNIPRKYIDELPDTYDCDPDDINLSQDSDFDLVKRFYLLLNDLGKQEAVKRMEELTLLPQYKNVKSGPKT